MPGVETEVAVSSDPTPAIALRYRWKRGHTYRFKARTQDRISVRGLGPSIRQVFRGRTEFALHVDGVAPDGSAEAVLEIESFDVSDDRGNRVAGLESIPAGALTSPVEIDATGRFRFQRVIYLVVDEQGDNYLVSGVVGPTGVSASAQADGESVTVNAQFDPRTGRLSGGYSVNQVAKKTRRVRVRQDARRIDLLPVQLLSLLRLPESTGGGSATFEMPGANTQITVSTLEATEESATLRLVAASDVDPSAAGSGPGAMPGMDGVPDIGGMGGVPGSAGGSAMTLDCDVTTRFDVAEGMLEGVTGTVTSSTRVGPMRIDTTSEVSLQRRN